jgi:hypothetical protein
MKNRIPAILFACFCFGVLHAQTVEELTILKEAKAAELTTLEGQLKDVTTTVEALKTEIAGLMDKITPYPRWDIGATGNLGFNFSVFNDWLSKSTPNTSAVTVGFAGGGYANLDQRKYFWRNKLDVTLGWQRFDDRDDPTDSKDYKITADALTLGSLFGYKLSKTWALSAYAEYRTSMFDGKLNDPGFLDLGAGATWTPITDLVVIIHPLNYNFVFSDSGFDYKSSMGCKVVADYKKQITKGIAWKSNLSLFMSYQGSDLSNWTWTNGLTTAVKGFGVGLDFGLRGNKQEALAAGLTDNPLQTYWVLGLTYALGSK